MVRRPDVCLTKDVCIVRGGMNDERLKRWLYAQHDGGLSLAGDCPVLAAFYNQFPSGDSQGELSEYSDAHKFKAGKQCGEITDEARYSFWVAFGLTPDEQLAIERDLLNWTPNLTRGDADRRVTLMDYCLR